MFEDIYQKFEVRESRPRQLESLLSKYKEVKKYQELYGSLSPVIHNKARNRNREQALRTIRRELKKRLKPEETYEVWHEKLHVNVNLGQSKSSDPTTRHIMSTPTSASRDSSDISDSDDDDPKAASENSLATYRLQRFTESFDTTSDWIKSNFILRTNGLEVLPYHKYEGGRPVKDQHINNLKTLLHLQMLRRNWSLAYKIFCLLVRLPVDIRSLWPIGVEILKRKGDQNHNELENQNELGSTSSEMHSSGRSSGSRVSVRTVLDEKFFDWLSTFYIIPNVNSANLTTHSKEISAPIWRSGSKYHAPLYIVSALWNLLTKGEYVKLKDKLENLLLEPPYNIEGEFYFLLVLCYIEELIHLADKYLHVSNNNGFHSKTEIYNQILGKTKIIEQNLGKCDELHYQYPKELIVDQVAAILKSLDSRYVVENSDATSSDSEEENVVEDEPLQINDIHGEEIDDEEEDMKTYIERIKLATPQPEERETGRMIADHENGHVTGEQTDYFADEEDAQMVAKDVNMDFDFDFD